MFYLGPFIISIVFSGTHVQSQGDVCYVVWTVRVYQRLLLVSRHELRSPACGTLSSDVLQVPRTCDFITLWDATVNVAPLVKTTRDSLQRHLQPQKLCDAHNLLRSRGLRKSYRKVYCRQE